MSNDRELLELAARAYVPEHWRKNENYMKGFMETFNPRYKCEDAFSLAAHLRFSVIFDEESVKVQDEFCTIEIVVDRINCIKDAGRLAIVRAAAEIGRKMK